MPEITSLTKHRVQVFWPLPTRPKIEVDGYAFRVAKVVLEYQQQSAGSWKLTLVDATGTMFTSEGSPDGHGTVDYRYRDKPELILNLIDEHRPSRAL
jgi:hypothetical protein